MREIQSPQELEELLDSSDNFAIFYFWKNCGHCQRMHKPYDELEKDHKDVKFVKVETENIPKRLGKTSFPEFEVREGKKVKAKAGGEMSKDELNKQLFGGTNGGRRRRNRTRRLRRRTTKRLH